MKKIDKKEVIQEFLEFLEKKFQISGKEIIKTIKKKEIYEIPISIFDNEYLSVLESICKYLKENQNLIFSQIASLTNRDQRAIGKTYYNARKKLAKKFIIKEPKFFIPLSIFKNRKLGVLEVLVLYLRKKRQLTFHQIALLLNRNDRTVWTSYYRVKKKRGDIK